VRVRRAAAVLLSAWLSTAALAREPVVVIDAGHGGEQEGAVGPGKLLEKNVCLTLALRLSEALQALGAKVVLTRAEDVHVPLAERVALANRARPDLVISLHANSMPTRRMRERAEGIETFFLSSFASGEGARQTAARENEEGLRGASPKSGDTLAFILADLARAEAHAESSRLAYTVHQRMIASTGAVDRGVQQAPFYVLSGVDAPAILIEAGFVSHPGESQRLRDPDYQGKLIAAIAEGVKSFLQLGELKHGGAPTVGPATR
jgi:N-acetylmuramoyl-L-alanine amidase